MFKKFIVGAVAAVALVLGAALPAQASGSDGPTPYTVTTQGIYLPDVDVFTDASHVNVRDDKGKTYSIHFESKYADPNNPEWRNLPFNHQDPRNQFYGQSFLPWEALGGFNAKEPFCVTWVQIHTNKGYNQHFGEGGQEPVGTGCQTPPDLIEPGEWSQVVFTCDSQVGDVVDRTRQVKVTKFKWDGTVKSVETVTENGTYTVQESDLWGLDCRQVVEVVAPTLQLATGTCVAEQPVYTPAVLTLPTISNGSWSRDGEPVSGDVELTNTTEFTFTVDEGYKLGALPTPDGSYWTVTGDDTTATFAVAPNLVGDLDCELANSGMEIPVIAVGVAVVAVLGGVFLLRRRA
jgi:hypothetical protein